MKRTLFVMAVVLGFATAASAATLSVVSNKLTYATGEAITLTVTGNAAGETAYSLIGRLLYDPALTSTTSATPGVASPGTWLQGTIETGDGFAEVFNIIDTSFLGQTATFPGGIVGTASLVADAVGVVNVTWSNSLSFFSVQGTNPGTSFTIVPEPTTAVLLGLGLFGLAVGGRRRS